MSSGLGPGDRIVFLGLGPRGRHADVIWAGRVFANLRFDDGRGSLALAKDCHPIPRRPRPDF